MKKRWEREAVVLQCAYALAQGLGKSRELTPAQLEKLRERLTPILDELGLEGWNPRIGMRRFREAGRLAARSKKKGLAAVWSGLQKATLKSRTAYCQRMQTRLFGRSPA